MRQTESVRLFVAAEIGDRLARKAAALSRELQQRAVDMVPNAKITWVPAERLHLTIRFLGNLEDERVNALVAHLGPSLGIPAFELTLQGVGAFPKSGSPRVLWVGVAHGRDALLAVERIVSSRLLSMGIEHEGRAYSPHLTVARVRDAAGLRTIRLLDGVTDRRIGTTRIDAITLFQSALSPKGPTYTPLAHIPCEP